MKKIEIKNKLTLNKEIIANLVDITQLKKIKGGIDQNEDKELASLWRCSKKCSATMCCDFL